MAINTQFTKPIVVVSKCLGFEACRYNGRVIPESFVDKLKQHIRCGLYAEA